MTAINELMADFVFDPELIVEGDSLSDLFAQADRIGDKYLTEDELQDRTDKLQAQYDEFEANSVQD
jgi:hypothetical protein